MPNLIRILKRKDVFTIINKNGSLENAIKRKAFLLFDV